MASTGVSPDCAVCNEPAFKLCKNCGSIRYCSIECQKADWSIHEYICKVWTKQTERPSPPPYDIRKTTKLRNGLEWPSSKMRRAIIFDPESTSPRIAWFECYLEIHGYENVLIDLGDGPKLQGPKPVMWNLRRYRPLENTLQIAYHDAFLTDGSKPNKALQRVTGGATPHEWRGPIVAMRKQGKGIDAAFYDDISAGDFRDVIDWFMIGGKDGPDPLKTTIPSSPASKRSGKIKGVRAACIGETAHNGKEGEAGRCTSVEVSSKHQVWATGEIPQISRLIGLPVRLWRFPMGNPPWKDHTQALCNPGITFLTMRADPADAEGVGLALLRWAGSAAGSVLVVRTDGQDIMPFEVEALGHFCEMHLQPIFEEACDGETPARTREEAAGFATAEKFRKYRDKYREEQDALSSSFEAIQLT